MDKKALDDKQLKNCKKREKTLYKMINYYYNIYEFSKMKKYKKENDTNENKILFKNFIGI